MVSLGGNLRREIVATTQQPVNVFEYERLAKEKLPGMVYDYYASGANDEITLRDNHEAYDRIKLRYRVLVDVSKLNLQTSVYGQSISMPIIVAPMAFQGMAHPDGELATARATGNAGTIMVLSTLSNNSIEAVTREATGPVWFQLYVFKDRGVTKSLVQRAEAAGCKALVLTVDSPYLGRRERDIRNGFSLGGALKAKNLEKSAQEHVPAKKDTSGLAAYLEAFYDTGLTWKDIEWFKSITKLPVLVKGIARGDDAKLAIEHGVDGIIVSNHGGRQLDTSPATIDVLPEIIEAVDRKFDVIVDGGIRRGTDVVKALAYGAKAVLVGRPILWGLATEGEAGVSRVLNMYREDLETSMALCGCTSPAQIKPDLIWTRK